MGKQRLHFRISKRGLRFRAGRGFGFRTKTKNYFFDARIGRYGPYMAGGVKHKGTFVGGSIGTLGKKVWIGHYGKKFSGSVSHNLSTGIAGGRLRVKKLKFKF